MTQYNSLNVKLSNSHLNKFKSAIKNENEVVLRLSSNVVGDNETNFHHKSLLTNRQVSNLRKGFADYLSADIKLSKTQLSKMIQSTGFLICRLLGPLLKTRLPLIKNVIKPLTKSALTVCSCHVTYAFESESTLYSCLNVKELLARGRREI